MKKTRAIAIFLTCITAASMGATILTGCSGGKDSSTSSSEVSVRAIQDDELESQTDSDSEAENSSQESSAEESTSAEATVYTGDITPEQAVELVSKGYEAYGQMDWNAVCDYTNIDLYAYLDEGKWLTKDEILAMAAEQDSETESGEGYMYGNPDSFTYGEAVLMNEEELQELNDFIQEMDDDGNPVDYIVDAAYVVPLEFKETDSDETGLTDYAPTMLAVKVCDTWKADIMMTTMQAMYNAFDNGDISFSNSSNDNADDFDEEITIGDAENTEN